MHPIFILLAGDTPRRYEKEIFNMATPKDSTLLTVLIKEPGELPRMAAVLASDPQFRQQCGELLDVDLRDQRALVHLLVRNAVTHNRFGTVLLSSTDRNHLQAICAAACVPLPNEAEVARMIRQKCLDTRVER